MMPDTDHPWILYGTAWKKERTAALVMKALSQGFTALDTANQPKHYQEPLVGEALKRLFSEGVSRDHLFLQTKFTPLDGHDHRVPYDPQAGLTIQVEQSFESSLEHLGTDYVDSYLLHGPYHYPGLGKEDWQVWAAIERIYRSGRAHFVGVSNVNAGQLRELVENATVRPMIVQNRCFAHRGWDKAVRDICSSHHIIYQGFSLLTANPYVLGDARVRQIASRLHATSEQVIFCFARQIGIKALTGTTNGVHMLDDLKTAQMELTPEEVSLIETIALET